MDSPLQLPAAFARTQVEVYGSNGAAWLERLPGLIATMAELWRLRVAAPFPNLSYNYVAPALREDGSQAVLKIGYPSGELLSEIAALRLYDGHGITRLLETDPQSGAFLIERLLPGTTLATLDDDAATTIAAGVMRRLWRPLPAEHPFRSVADWGRGFERLRAQFDGGAGPFPPALVERAERLFAELLASSSAPVLLHGDLHHYNILAAEREPWLALDPKGITGEPEYEVGALLRNPSPQVYGWPDLPLILARRLDLLADQLAFSRERLLGWSFSQAVLSAWWTYEDHGHDWEQPMALAAQLAALQ